MARGKDEKGGFSRRSFLRGMRWAPLLFLPAPIRGICFPSVRHEQPGNRSAGFPLADFRLTPLYPAKSPLEDVLSRVVPGSDEYVTEKYAFELMRLLGEWSEALKSSQSDLAVVGMGGGERIGIWKNEWAGDASHGWRIIRRAASQRNLGPARRTVFIGSPTPALGPTESYRN